MKKSVILLLFLLLLASCTIDTEGQATHSPELPRALPAHQDDVQQSAIVDVTEEEIESDTRSSPFEK